MDNNEHFKVESYISDSRLAFLQGRYDESLKLAKCAIALASNNADANQCAGNAYMSFGDYESAIKHYKKAVENDANNGDRYFNLGYAYASDNQPVKALEMFAKADEVGCSPNVVGQLYKIMAMLCFDMHRFNDAILNFIKSENSNQMAFTRLN
jgi:pentatricopeptide repeat protein